MRGFDTHSGPLPLSLLSTRPIREEEEEGRGPSSRKQIRCRWIVIGATCNYSNLPGWYTWTPGVGARRRLLTNGCSVKSCRSMREFSRRDMRSNFEFYDVEPAGCWLFSVRVLFFIWPASSARGNGVVKGRNGEMFFLYFSSKEWNNFRQIVIYPLLWLYARFLIHVKIEVYEFVIRKIYTW